MQGDPKGPQQEVGLVACYVAASKAMTDQEAVRIVEGLRSSTQNPVIAEVCDWVLAMAQRDAVAMARRAHRNAYMAALMRRLRRERAARERRGG